MLLVQAQQLGRAGLAASLSVAELASGYNTLPNRLRWMLKETMGADGEFERRRAELESEDVLLPPNRRSGGGVFGCAQP